MGTIEQHKRDAANALVAAADYQQYVRFQADRLVDAVLPHAKAIVLHELDAELPGSDHQ